MCGLFILLTVELAKPIWFTKTSILEVEAKPYLFFTQFEVEMFLNIVYMFSTLKTSFFFTNGGVDVESSSILKRTQIVIYIRPHCCQKMKLTPSLIENEQKLIHFAHVFDILTRNGKIGHIFRFCLSQLQCRYRKFRIKSSAYQQNDTPGGDFYFILKK